MPQLLPYIAMSCATVQERDEIKARASKAGLSVSNYLRQLNGLDPLKRHELTREEQRAGQAAGIVTKKLNKEGERPLPIREEASRVRVETRRIS